MRIVYRLSNKIIANSSAMTQRSPLQILRSIPAKLLQRYFQTYCGVLHNVDFSALKPTEIQSIVEALSVLPRSQQQLIEGQLRMIDAMACPGGALALASQAELHHDHNFIRDLRRIPGHPAKAMWAFLKKKQYWRAASCLVRSDALVDKAWKKRVNLPKRVADVSVNARRKLESAIGSYFSNREGRGANCHVQIYHRNGKQYFSVLSEDFAQSDAEWERGGLSFRPRRPAFEIIFVYCRHEGSLDIYAPGVPNAVPHLQRVFAETILKLQTLEGECPPQLVYDLSSLIRRDFRFNYTLSSGIKSVTLRGLRLAVDSGKRKIILEADSSESPHSVHELLESLRLPTYRVTQAYIAVCFSETPERREHARTFYVSHPNYCGLSHEPEDLTIRQMLIDSGIEPHATRIEDQEAA
jgi:hypothetical protein